MMVRPGLPHLLTLLTLLAASLLVLACTDLQVGDPLAIVQMRVTPDTVVLRIGDSAVVQAAPLDSTSTFQGQRVVTWTTASPSVASVDSTGKVKGLAAGIATVTAMVDNITDEATIIVTGAPAAIAIQGGDNQTAAVNAAVPVAPAVRVVDATGNPVPNAPVTFAVTGGGGVVAAASPVLTDFDGVATATSWILGPSPGANTLTATAGDSMVAGNPATFTATATVGSPSVGQSSVDAEPEVISPSSGASFATITVTVRDSAGSTISGATVVLASTGTGNVLTQPTDTTDGFGRVTGALSSTVAESKIISATVNGAVAVFQRDTILVSNAAAVGLGIFTQPAGAAGNAAFATQPVVDIVDGFGNRVPSATNPVTVTLVAGNGTLTGTSMTVNAVAGRATFSGLLIRGTRVAGDTLGTGPHALQFTAPGFSAVRSDTFQVGVSFAYNLLADVFSRNGCTGCHGFTFANSVNGAATLGACAGAIRVVPSDTTNSVLYAKVKTASPPCGTVMPTGGLMSQLQIQLIRDWILQGAPNN